MRMTKDNRMLQRSQTYVFKSLVTRLCNWSNVDKMANPEEELNETKVLICIVFLYVKTDVKENPGLLTYKSKLDWNNINHNQQEARPYCNCCCDTVATAADFFSTATLDSNHCKSCWIVLPKAICKHKPYTSSLLALVILNTASSFIRYLLEQLSPALSLWTAKGVGKLIKIHFTSMSATLCAAANASSAPHCTKLAQLSGSCQRRAKAVA